jgi:hypothetical protein
MADQIATLPAGARNDQKVLRHSLIAKRKDTKSEFHGRCQGVAPEKERTPTSGFQMRKRLGVFKSRHGGTLHEHPRLHPHRLRHCRAFVFFRLWRKNPSHPLCERSVTRPC